ncbi:MAG: substrate-binding domain-containing protein [Brevinematales bacterium]|nr:substrate-binding domain-containing protein [Brevinematales bacterium]
MKNKFQQSRFTFGVLINQIEGEYQQFICKGINDAAIEKNVNILFFVGGTIGNFFEGDEGNNLTYELAKTNVLDGLIVCSGSIGGYVSTDRLYQYIYDYRNIPKVSISIELNGCFSILIDNRNAMKEVIDHLIDFHGYENIAFVSGPLTNSEVTERLKGYMDSLKAHNISYKPELIIEGNFTYDSGVRAVNLLIDERKVNFDAIACANDGMAMGVYDGLKKRGLLAPNDYALTGFDDYIQASLFSIPLTTVKQPLYEQGKKSVEILIEILEGKNVPEKLYLPTNLVLRESCGCFLRNYLTKDKILELKNKKELITTLINEKEEIISHLNKKFGSNKTNFKEYSIHLKGLIDSLIIDLEKKKTKGVFILVLNDIFSKMVSDYDYLQKWNEILDELYLLITNISSFDENFLTLERIFSEAHRLIDLYIMRIENAKIEHLNNYIWLLRMLICHLDYEFNLDEISNILYNELSTFFDIKSFFMFLFNERNTDISKTSKVQLAFDERGRIDEKKEKTTFFTNELIPFSFILESKRYSLIFFILFTKYDNFGYMAIELNNKIPVFLYPTLRERISSAIQTSIIFNQKEKTGIELNSALLKLKRDEEKYRDMVEMLPLGIIETDEKYNIININKKALQVLEISNEKANLKELIIEKKKFEDYLKLVIKKSHSDFIDFTISTLKGNKVSVLCRIDLINYETYLSGYRFVIIELASFVRLSVLPGEQFYDKYQITKREREVLEKILQGESISEVSEKFHITIGTVKDHLSSIYKKTKVKNKKELIKKIKEEKSIREEF